jgi:hypothetical protein
MADMEKVLGRLAIAIPLVHVVTCGLYLAGYSAGFGARIGGMFLPSDFFTITIQMLIQLYTLNLGLPVLILFVRYIYVDGYASDVIFKPTEHQTIQDLTANISALKKILIVINTLCIFLGIVAIANLTAEIIVGVKLSIRFTCSFLMLAGLPLWWKFATKLKRGGWQVEFAFLCTYFVIGIWAAGVENGQMDRRAEYSNFVGRRMTCGDHVILGPIGSRFLSIMPNGQRQIIDENCKIIFGFVKAPPFTVGPAVPLALQKLNESKQ